MPTVVLKVIISIIALALLIVHFMRPNMLDITSLCLLGIAILPWISDLIKSVEFPSGFKIEFQELKGEVARQERLLEQLTEFLFTHFVTEAEFKHLDGLYKKIPYPFERASYFDSELRRLRSLGLVDVWVGAIPSCGEDLNQYAKITAKGCDYVKHRELFGHDNI